MSRAVDQGGDGRLLQVRLPGRLANENNQKRAIADRISAVLSGEASEVDDHVCKVSARTFLLDISLFLSQRGHNLTMSEIENFLKQSFGIENPNVLLNWRPGHAAVLIHFESAVPDKVLGGIFKHLKADTKKQFSGCLPGFLCVHLADLNHEQLLDLYNTAQGGTTTGIELAVNLLLERRPHLYGVALMADGEVRITEERSNGGVTTSVQEVGPSYVIKNSKHPMAGTELLEQLFA